MQFQRNERGTWGLAYGGVERYTARAVGSSNIPRVRQVMGMLSNFLRGLTWESAEKLGKSKKKFLLGPGKRWRGSPVDGNHECRFAPLKKKLSDPTIATK